MLELTAEFDIQLDNLCQFLPQDRVDAFSKMTPPQLLLETQKALGSTAGNLHELQAELVRLQDAGSGEAAALAALKKRHVDLTEEVGLLERERGRQEQRAAYFAQAALLDGKLKWMRFEETRKEAQGLKTAEEEKKKEWKAAKDSIAPKEKELERAAKEEKASKAALSDSREAAQHADAKGQFESLQAEYNQLKKEFKDAKAEIKRLKQAAESEAPLKRAALGCEASDADDNVNTDLGTKLHDLPDNVAELEAKKATEEQLASSISGNPAVVWQYEERKKELGEVDAKLKGDEEAQAGRASQLQRLKKEWLDKLVPVQQKIDACFRDFFFEFGCEGMVALGRHDDGDLHQEAPIAKWGMEIHVKVRARSGGGGLVVCTIVASTRG